MKEILFSFYRTKLIDISLLNNYISSNAIGSKIASSLQLNSELYFTPVLWPDFSSEELKKAVFWFTGRNRRFGGLTEASR